MTSMKTISCILVLVFALGKPALATEANPESLPEVEVKLLGTPVMTIDQQRDNYLDALRAARSGRVSEMRQKIAAMENYPLIGHVEFEHYKRHIKTTPDQDIVRFLNTNSHMVFADYLRQRWLQQLVQRGDWALFMKHYRNDRERKDKQLVCYRLSHLLKVSPDQAAVMAEIEKLWLSDKRLSNACNPVFRAWRSAGHMTRDLVWERIKLAMEARRISLARELSYYLPKENRIWVTRWINMHRRPATELKKINYPVMTPVSRMIIKHGIGRLAYRDPEAAMERWQELKQTYQFFGEDENYVLRKVGILAARHHLPQAVDWLSAVSVNEHDDELAEWRVRAALRNGSWDRAEYFLTALPLGAQEEEEWRYWRARILEKKGHQAAARKEFERLALSRSYYGFMASDHIGVSYTMQHKSVGVQHEELNNMIQRPGIAVARELHAVGNIVTARRQWHWMIKKMNRRELQIAAVVAKNWGWYDRAILTVSKSGHLDDLDLRFPVLYRDKVEQNADRSGLDSGWIFGVMRQESAFVPDARSGAGALGLMQLMPATGRQTARRLKLNIRSRSAILNVDNNLKLGSAYLKRVLDRTEGNHTLATASYNAGPHRVKSWMPDQDMDADIWVESVPFTETRNYIKNVFGFAAIYDHRLGNKPMRVKNRMPLIEGKESDN